MFDLHRKRLGLTQRSTLSTQAFRRGGADQLDLFG
jgi:hypothetical protein